MPFIGVEQILNRLTRDNLIIGDKIETAPTFTFICTTLWHETELELETLLSQGIIDKMKPQFHPYEKEPRMIFK